MRAATSSTPSNRTERFSLPPCRRQAYGIVWKALDKRTKQVVAVKKIFDAFQNSTDAQRTFREITFLQQLASHQNIVKLLNVFKADNDRDIYLIFEFMDTDLHHVIRAGILQDIHQKYVMYQLFRCLKYLHSASILHRDIKPSNLLVNSGCLLKVADFGLARSMTHGIDEPITAPMLTDYVATRWYRAPEILLGSTEYNFGVDMWSCGCILGELLSGKPIFPGTSTMNQLEKVLGLTGRPCREDIESVKSPFAATMLGSLPPSKPQLLEEVFPNASGEALDLLKGLLQFNPEKRLTAATALKHPYLAMFHNPSDEPTSPSEITTPIDGFIRYSVAQYRDKLYTTILQKKKEVRAQVRENRASKFQSNSFGGDHFGKPNSQYEQNSDASISETDSVASDATFAEQTHGMIAAVRL